MTELLLHTDLSEEQRSLIEGLRAASAHLRLIAGHVIDRAPGDASFFALRPARHALTEFLEPVLVSARARCAQRGVGFVLEAREPLPREVELDAGRCGRSSRT